MQAIKTILIENQNVFSTFAARVSAPSLQNQETLKEIQEAPQEAISFSLCKCTTTFFLGSNLFPAEQAFSSHQHLSSPRRVLNLRTMSITQKRRNAQRRNLHQSTLPQGNPVSMSFNKLSCFVTINNRLS